MNEICAVRPNHLTEGEVEDEKKNRADLIPVRTI